MMALELRFVQLSVPRARMDFLSECSDADYRFYIAVHQYKVSRHNV